MTNTTHHRVAEVVEAVERAGIVAVIRMKDPNKLQAVVDAIAEGGIRALEITMTVPDAIGAIGRVADAFGNSVLLGAGTVTSRELAEGSLDAGAEFLVTPCVVPDVIAVAKARGVAVLPGAITPTEVFTAWSLGGDIIKIFPASNVGGASYLKALKGPFPQIPLCPTGGVTLDNMNAYFTAGAALVGVGNNLLDQAALAAGDIGRVIAGARRLLDPTASAA